MELIGELTHNPEEVVPKQTLSRNLKPVFSFFMYLLEIIYLFHLLCFLCTTDFFTRIKR